MEDRQPGSQQPPQAISAQTQEQESMQSPEQAPRQGGTATQEQNDLLERVVINAMRVISGETGSTVDGLLSAGQTAGEGLSNAIAYVLQAVIGGLQKKGVEVGPDLILSENGAASQIAQLLVALLGASGKDVSPNEIQKALEVGLSNFGVKQSQQGSQGQQESGPPVGPPQADGPSQQTPWRGLLEGAQQ